MTIKRVWIFGDSYADPHWEKERYVHETWYEMLAKQYGYKNFAMAGTGAHYSMKEFYRRYKQFNEEDLVVWVLSGEDRIQFHLPDKFRTNNRGDINLVHESYWDFKRQEVLFKDPTSCDLVDNFDESFHKTHKDHMSFTMKTFEKEVINSNKKNESFLYTISRIQKCKICIFFLNYDNSYIKNSLNDDSFYIHPRGFERVSEEEYSDPGLPFYEDNKRNNHLSEANHKIMYNIINNFVQGIHEMPEFKQNLLEEPERKTDRFIYD